MYRALFRKGFGDLRTRRVQTALLFIVVAAAAAILMLAISLPQSVAGSFDRAHDEAHGAHVWYGANGPEAAERVSKLPGRGRIDAGVRERQRRLDGGERTGRRILHGHWAR